MAISNTPATHSDEAGRSAIFNKELAKRLHIASESDEELIRVAAANVLGAKEDLLRGYEAMTGTSFESDDSIPTAEDEPTQIILAPIEGSSSELPEPDEERDAWDTLYAKILARQFIIQLLENTEKSN